MARNRYKELQKLLQSQTVRAKVAQVADRVARDAKAIAEAEGADEVVIGREDGTRPLGRPYSRVTAPLDQEFGTSRVQRRRILGRATKR